MMGLRIDPELKKFLQKMADDENRTLSNFIINAVLTYIKDHKGIDWKKANKQIEPISRAVKDLLKKYEKKAKE